ncbi:MAG: TonB-dependent receptor [Bacteroidetes bacterium]|nr:TonB-dependent receptor [Bacteroidota bacterium]
MQKTIGYFIAFLFLLPTLVLAQTKYSLSGTVRDKQNGELLVGATISLEGKPTFGTTANEYGFYSLSLPEGNQTIVVFYIGYEVQKINLDILSNKNLDIFLLPASVELSEVVVSSEGKDQNLSTAQMGTEVIKMKDIEKLPVLLGEKDILKTIQLLPGIKSSGEGNSGFSVRGGGLDQNLILLDEAPVYNASHLFGFFSTFNSDALKDATIIKGNPPAQYGGRLSSVLDIKMKDGNNQKFETNGGIGLISSRLTIEGPIQKGKSSFIISGRRTYADLFLGLSDLYRDNSLFFYDLNMKANFQINDKNRIYISGYFGRDILGLSNSFNTNWGNSTGTIRWNKIINTKLFVNTSLIYSNYNYDINFSNEVVNVKLQSKIQDWHLKKDFSWFLSDKHTIKFGINSIYHTISPSNISGSLESISQKPPRTSLEKAVYINDDYKVSKRLTISHGLRLSSFTILGGDIYNIYENGILVNSVQLSKGKLGKTYFNVEPRLSANYRINDVSSIKIAYARNTQNLHLLSNSNSGNPTDLWIGSSYTVKPEISDQISTGYSRNFDHNNYEVNVEAYYKNMQNQIDYRDGAEIAFSAGRDIEADLLFGKGRAYGIEFIAKKKEGRLTGWVAYTLSKTERKIDGINNNQWYNSRLDRTHDLSVVASYNISPKWSLSGVFVYSTGNAVTFLTGKYEINGQTVFHYDSRNADRMPDYHRLDLSATYEGNKGKKLKGSWTIGVYNVYGRQNPFSIAFQDNPNNPGTTQAIQTSLFRWIPSVTYNFKF